MAAVAAAADTLRPGNFVDTTRGGYPRTCGAFARERGCRTVK